jgi:hypothetical protein
MTLSKVFIPVQRRFHPEVVIVPGQGLQIVHLISVLFKLVLVVETILELIYVPGIGIIQTFLFQDGVASSFGDDIIRFIAVLPSLHNDIRSLAQGFSRLEDPRIGTCLLSQTVVHVRLMYGITLNRFGQYIFNIPKIPFGCGYTGHQESVCDSRSRSPVIGQEANRIFSCVPPYSGVR